MSARRAPARRVRTRSGGPAPRGEAVEQPLELAAVAHRAGVRVSLVRRYLAFGLLEPSAGTSAAPLFSPTSAARVAKAERLRRDLDLNYAGAVLVCELLDRIRALELERGDR